MPRTLYLRCTEEAAFEPVTLEEAKLHARVDIDDDNLLITSMIKAARQHAERKTGRVLRASTWSWGVAPNGPVLQVPVAPCSECTSILVDGVEVNTGLYSFTPSGSGGNEAPLLARLELLPDFPIGESVTVNLVAGWAEDNTPDAIKQWMLVRVSTLYGQRESFVAGVNVNELGHSFVDALLDPFIIPKVI